MYIYTFPLYPSLQEEQHNLIKKLTGDGKTYKEVQKTKGYSAKIISNALKW